MATREEYNQCIKPHITGTGKTKEQRKLDFCIGAKLCSGKAKTEKEARAICDVPRLPKWAKQILPKEEPISCTDKSKRVKESIDTISLKVSAGEAEDVRPLAAQLMNDIFTCNTDKTVHELISETMQEFNDISKRHYLKGEAKELQKNLQLLKEII